ncbi:MAG: membrane-bound lytic murein transglycosylase MltF [Pseudomonadota bacterium]
MASPSHSDSTSRSLLLGTQSRLQWLWTGGFALLGLGLLTFTLTRPPPPPPLPQLAEVQNRGELRVATVNSPVTYYNLQERDTGLEYDLAGRLAEDLNVRLRMITVDSFSQLLEAVDSGRADLAAANITVTPGRQARVRFSEPYTETIQYVVYKAGNRKPRSLADLAGRSMVVVADSSYAETLEGFGDRLAELTWRQSSEDIESLFNAVSNAEEDLTIADSTVLEIQQRFFPTLRKGFALTEPQPIAWAFPVDRDDSLLSAANRTLRELRDSGELADIKDRYHAHIAYYDRSNSHYFLRHIRSRLPDLKSYFVAAGEQNELDWRLLAAIGYAESLWDPNAVSPTGVRGVMMLTSSTARMVGVTEREDPAQSIGGGARYLKRVLKKIPRRIPEPDRIWLALAAYNIGFSHLEDARILTQRAGQDPDRWDDVVQHLPKLNQPQWYRTTRHGYSRGREAAAYVRNIQSYYDILNWALATKNDQSTPELAP